MEWDEVEKWYDNFLLQNTEERVIEKLSYDKNGKKLKLPKPERIREIVIEEIKILKGESDGESILDRSRSFHD